MSGRMLIPRDPLAKGGLVNVVAESELSLGAGTNADWHVTPARTSVS